MQQRPSSFNLSKFKNSNITKKNNDVCYAVKKGFKTGIFNTWLETKSVIEHYKNANYKKFKTKFDALKWLNSTFSDDDDFTSTENNSEKKEEFDKFVKNEEHCIKEKEENKFSSTSNKTEKIINFKFNEHFYEMLHVEDNDNINWIRKDYYYLAALTTNNYIASICYWENYNIENRWQIPDSNCNIEHYFKFANNKFRYMCDKMIFEFILELLTQINNKHPHVIFKFVQKDCFYNNTTVYNNNDSNIIEENNNLINLSLLESSLNIYFTNPTVYRVLKQWINCYTQSKNGDENKFKNMFTTINIEKMYNMYIKKIFSIIDYNHDNLNTNLQKIIWLNFELLPAKSSSILYKKNIQQLESYSTTILQQKICILGVPLNNDN